MKRDETAVRQRYAEGTRGLRMAKGGAVCAPCDAAKSAPVKPPAGLQKYGMGYRRTKT